MQLALLVAVNDPAAVVTLAVHQSVEIGFDVLTNGFWLGEVHWSALYCGYLASGDELCGGRQVVVCKQLQLVVENVAIAFAFQVEIAVIGEVDNSGSVGGGRKLENYLIVVGESVTGLSLELTGIAGFAVFEM